LVLILLYDLAQPKNAPKALGEIGGIKKGGKEGIMEKHFPKKAFFAFLFLAAGLLIFTLSAETLAQPKPIKAILNVPWGPETAVGLQHKDFVDLVTQKTNGRLQIEAYYASSLYGLDQQTPMLQKNVIQFGAQSGWFWQKLDPACTLTWCPFFFPSKEKMALWYRAQKVQDFLESYMGKKYGLMNLPDIGWVGSNPFI
jgi:TRAP-type C4-dicarboxylate transport system substrate-binding protein